MGKGMEGKDRTEQSREHANRTDQDRTVKESRAGQGKAESKQAYESGKKYGIA